MTAPRAARVETPADTLRRASARLRELATEATPGPWWNESGTVHAPYPAREPGAACHPLDGQGQNGLDADADAEWAGTLGPQIAEPLAAWLDWASCTPGQATHHAAALTLAHALLGSPVPEPDGEGTT